MKKFSYTIQDSAGIHARPAGIIVKEAQKFSSAIKIHFKEKEADAKKIFSVMSLGVRCGDEITVSAEGNDEAEAIDVLSSAFRKQL